MKEPPTLHNETQLNPFHTVSENVNHIKQYYVHTVVLARNVKWKNSNLKINVSFSLCNIKHSKTYKSKTLATSSNFWDSQWPFSFLKSWQHWFLARFGWWREGLFNRKSVLGSCFSLSCLFLGIIQDRTTSSGQSFHERILEGNLQCLDH